MIGPSVFSVISESSDSHFRKLDNAAGGHACVGTLTADRA